MGGLVLALVFLFSLTVHSRGRTTLQSLEAVVSKAENLDEFLSNEGLVTEYFHTVQKFYGLDDERFPRENYDIFISQLRDLSKKSTKFADAIWSPRVQGAKHSLKAVKGPDVWKLNREKLKSFWEGYEQDVLKMAPEHFPEHNPESSPTQVYDFLVELDKEINEFLESTRTLGKKKRKVAESEFYTTLRGRPDVRVAMYLYSLYLLKMKNIHTDLETVEPHDFIQRLDSVMQASEVEIPKSYRQLGSWFLPMKSHLLEAGVLSTQALNVFRGTLSPGTYSFTPSPRPLHTIFKGVCFRECVGGDAANIGNLTPERWASAVLDDAQFYFVQHEGEHRGWVQLIPFYSQKEQKTFYNVESGTQVFNSDINLEDAPDRPINTFHAWLTEYEKLGFFEDRMIIGQNNAINNAGSLMHIRDSLIHRLSGFTGNHSDLESTDIDMVEFIHSASPQNGPEGNDLISSYKPSKMILDSTTPNSGGVRRLSIVDVELLTDRKKLEDHFEKQEQRNWQLRYISQFLQFDYEDPEMTKMITGWWKQTTEKEREKILSDLQKDAQFGILRNSKLLREQVLVTPEVIKQVFNDNPENSVHYVHISMARFKDVLGKQFFDEPLLVELTKAVPTIDSSINIRRMFLPYADTPEKFIKYVMPYVGNPNEAYKQALDKLARDHIDQFFEMSPTMSQLRALGGLAKTVTLTRLLHDNCFRRSENAAEFVECAQFYFSTQTDAYRIDMDELIAKYTDKFIGFQPTAEEVFLLQYSVKYVSTHIGLMEAFVPLMKTKKDWKKVMKTHYKKPSEPMVKAIKDLRSKYAHVEAQLPGRLHGLKKALGITGPGEADQRACSQLLGTQEI